jgi:glucokinase
MTAPTLLIGDIGGTNARFALASPERPAFDQVVKLSCSEFPTALEAIDHYLGQVGAGRPAAVCLAAAGPIVDCSVRFTNNHWRIDGATLEQHLGVRTVRLLNDFEAIALSLPFLGEEHLSPIGPARGGLDPAADFTVGVLGPGTGLGVAGLLGRQGQLYPIVGEGGHRGFAPESGRQIEVLQVLRERFERVSDERLLSGPGIVNIHHALQQLHGAAGEPIGAADIFSRAEAREDRLAVESVKLFFEVLGQVAGDLALQLGAVQGVFIAGGIVKRYPDLLAASGFRSAFELKGRHRSLMERVPTQLITHDDPGLLGAAYGAMRDFQGIDGPGKAS